MGKRKKNNSLNIRINKSSKNFKELVNENKQFEEYYKVNLSFDPDKWKLFLTSLQSNLEAAIHLSAYDKEALIVWKKMYKFLDKMKDEIINELKWYTLSLAWQISASRKEIRKTIEFSYFHKILVVESELGHMHRQEAVSLIPVQLLNIESHNIILDMCASPGSKTGQILELLNKPLSNKQTTPRGFVIANDSDNKRCYLLVHQTKRLRSPNLLVLNQDASFMPNIRFPIESNTSNSNVEPMFSYLQYDRILCDVPCTGDGTLRKNPMIWSKWNINQANSIHHLQLRILKRGLEMLKIGGQLVYSTCSLNPVENEAVIATILQLCQDSIEINDCADKLNGLIYSPGLAKWKVMSKDGTFYDDFDDVPKALSENHLKKSLFPPSDPKILDKLKYCIRIYPHLQNTGGFFVVAIKKVAELPWTTSAAKINSGSEAKISMNGSAFWKISHLPFAEKEAYMSDFSQPNGQKINNKISEIIYPNEDKAISLQNGNVDETEEQNTKLVTNFTNSIKNGRNKNKNCYKENPFKFLTGPTDPLWTNIQKFFEFSTDFGVKNLSYRSEDIVKKQGSLGNCEEAVTKESIKHNLYYVHPCIRAIILLNPDRLKVISTGLRVLAYNRSLKSDHPYRLCQDGISLISKFINKRIITIHFGDLEKFLTHENVKLEELSQNVQDNIKNVDGLGSVCLRLKYSVKDYEIGVDNSENSDTELNLSAWLAPTSIRLFLNKTEIQHYAFMFNIKLQDPLNNKPNDLEQNNKIE